MVSIQQQKVVVIGHGSTSRLGLVRAAAALGCEISVIVMTGRWRYTKQLKRLKPFDCYSKYISHVYYCHLNDGEGLIRVLLDRCTADEQRVILLPSSDFTAALIDENRERLSAHFLFPHLADASKSVRYWMDKEHQKAMARECGLHVPNSRVVAVRDGAYELPQGIGYPCFTKALVTIVGGKQCFNRCDDRDALCRALDAIGAKQDAQILVEDYKVIEKEYAVLGFSDGTEVIIPGIIHLLTQTQSHFGIAKRGEISPVAGFEALLEQFKTFVRRIGFVGIFDIDFYYSDDQFYFGEINLRFGGSGYAVTKLGVNLPAMLIRHLRGEDISQMKRQIDRTATYVNERMCEDDWYYGKITAAEYRRTLSSAEISFVRDEQDPRPQTVFGLVHRLHPIKKMLRKLLVR